MSVHPRLRGELVFFSVCLESIDGSSPLTRGTQLVQALDKMNQLVHPRLRGELT